MPGKLALEIFGFGCHLNDQLIGYLNRAVALCKTLEPSFVIFSGGATQQATAPGRTEARLMYDYVVPRCIELNETTWLLDTESFTSLENVWNAERILREHMSPDRFVTYTDAGRALKVRLCTYRHMPRWRVTQETYDMGSNPIAQIFSTNIETAMVFIPALHRPWALFRRWSAKRK